MLKKKRCCNRKAQMAAFVLIGLILLIGVSVFSYLTYIAKKAPGEKYALEKLPETLDKLSLDMLMTSCIRKVSDPQLIKIAKYGGTINPKPNEYRLYNHTRYRHLCEQKPGYTECVSSLLTRESMQQELEKKIKEEMVVCVAPALKFYKDRGYDIQASEVSTRVMIGTDDINVIVTYPLIVSKATTRISVSDYSARFDYPLGKLYDLAMQILNSENSKGYFNQEDWMYGHGVEVLIQKHRPYPDIIYRISKYDWQKRQHYIFNFALQGYDRLPEISGLASIGTRGQVIASPAAARSSAYDKDIGCCYNEHDGNCFENSDKNSCSNKGLAWRQGSCEKSGFTCGPLSEKKFDNRSGLCYGRECFNCEATYRDGDDVNDPSTYTGPQKKHGESWCVYEGPAGNGLDFVGSRHYKHICMDGVVLVEDCRDYRDELCAGETVGTDNEKLTRAVCRPNRWQDCHLYSNSKAECEDTSIRDCYWEEGQDEFVIGKPRDQSASPTTPYEDRYCIPQVPPGFKFWNQLEGMQVCGWANNYYECAAPGCFQEWTDFDAEFCAFQGDCGVYRNYIGKLPTLSLSKILPGAGQLPGIGSEGVGGGFASAPNQVTKDLFEYALPNEGNFRLRYYKKAEGLPTYPKQREQKQVTQDMFIHNSPNDYSLLGIMTFVQKFMRYAKSKVDSLNLWSILFKGESLQWDGMGISFCGVWMPSTSAVDCEKCNNNPYRPCTEYRCRSLGMFCSYEEINGVGTCSSYETATIGRPVVKFDGQVTPDYTLKHASLAGSSTVYVGREIKEPITSDYTFQIKTNRETQCMLTIAPGDGFGLNPPFPGTSADYSFSTRHNLTIPYLSADSLSVIMLPIELMTMISFDPDRLWSVFRSMANSIISDARGMVDKCYDNAPWTPGLSESDCEKGEKEVDRMESMFGEIKKFWESDLEPAMEKWLSFAEENALDDILRYATIHNQYHAFIKCRDRGGNENEEDLDFIRFRVNPNPLPPVEMPDTPPRITAVVPQNWSEQSAEKDGSKEVFVFVDQLAECAYSTKDVEFIYMENRFDCPASIYEGALGGGYMCNTTVPFSDLTNTEAPLYIKCIDHPEHYETFNFRLEPGSEFRAPPRISLIKPEAEEGEKIVIVEDPKIINASMPTIAVPETDVKFFIKFNAEAYDHEKALECKYAASPDKVDSSATTFIDPASGDPECNNCTAMLSATGTDYYMSCHFKTEERNEGTAMQYVLQKAAATS